MKLSTAIQWAWDLVLVAAAGWILFVFPGPAMLMMARHAFGANGVDLGRLSGLCQGLAMIVSLLGVLLAVSSRYSGALSRCQRIILTPFALASVVLALSGAVLMDQQLHTVVFVYHTAWWRHLLDWTNLPVVVLLVLFVVSVKTRHGIWTVLKNPFAPVHHFR